MTGSRTPRRRGAAGLADRLAGAGVSATGAATLGLAAWMYVMPASVTSPWGLNPPGLEQFRALWGVHAPALPAAVFRAGFWGLVAAAWAGYAVLVAAGLRGARFPRRAWMLALALAIALAAACPPLLSRDVYGYVGFGRLAANHHLNPMATPQSRLVALGDPVGPFLGGDVPSPYGPLWSGLSVALVRMTAGFGLVGQVVAFKLSMGLALLLAAWAARRAAAAIRPGAGALARPALGVWPAEPDVLARPPSAGRPAALTRQAGAAPLAGRAAPAPPDAGAGAGDRGALAFAAVAFNPLLLLEGPGTGHNDLAVLALVLAGFAAVAARRPRLAALAVGAGAAIKLVPILLLPGVVLAAGRGRRVRDAAGLALLGLLPMALALVPFWDGRATGAGLAAWWAEGHHGAAASPWPLALAAASYASVSWYVARAPDLPRLATGWALASAAAIAFAGGSWFPWYFAWPLAGLLVRWDRPHVAGTAFVMALVGLFTGFYAGP